MWRSLVARFVRDDEAAGSNPVTPTGPEAPGGFPGPRAAADSQVGPSVSE